MGGRATVEPREGIPAGNLGGEPPWEKREPPWERWDPRGKCGTPRGAAVCGVGVACRRGLSDVTDLHTGPAPGRGQRWRRRKVCGGAGAGSGARGAPAGWTR